MQQMPQGISRRRVPMKCAVCEKEIIGHGHNAEPLKEGKCCDNCNKLVILERIWRANENRTNDRK
jgi:hypothetical protein